MKPGISPPTERVHATGTRVDRTITLQSLLQPLLPRAFAAARCLTASATEAEKLVQETALLAREEFGTYQAGTKFKAWFLRIFINAFSMRCRASPRRPSTSADCAPDLYLYRKTSAAGWHEGSADPAQAFMGKLDTEQVAAAIGLLPEEYRVVVTLYFLEDLSYQEIASIMDGPVEEVRSLLHRGRKLLKVALWGVAESHGLV